MRLRRLVAIALAMTGGSVHVSAARSKRVGSSYIETAKELVKKVAPGYQFRLADDHYVGTDGIAHVYFKQTVHGMDIDNADFNVNISPDGKVFSYGQSVYSGPAPKHREPQKLVTPRDPLGAMKDMISILDLGVSTQGAIIKPIEGEDGRYVILGTRGCVRDPEARVEMDVMQKWYVTYMNTINARDIQGTINYVAQHAPPSGTLTVYPWGVPDPSSDSRRVIRNPWNRWASPFGWLSDGRSQFPTLKGNNAVATINISSRPKASNSNARGFASFDFEAGEATDDHHNARPGHRGPSYPLRAQTRPHVTTQDIKSSIYTRGSNVHGINQASAQGRPDLCARNFNEGLLSTPTHNPFCLYRPINPQDRFQYPYSPDLPKESYMDASLTQLFYTVNKYHDLLYVLGFDEKAGNFQSNNRGKGGKGNDFVLLYSQDGPGHNNANFATPPDGKNGRMSMFMWDQSEVERDGAFDAAIVIHEYTHGLSNRLTGGPANSGCLGSTESGGMGEGWSDFMALAVLINSTFNRYTDYRFSAWASNRPLGIRQYPYSTNLKTNPFNYAIVNSLDEVHVVGTVWATILWEVLWNLIDRHGFNDRDFPDLDARGVPRDGRYLAMKLVTSGMALQPCNPTMVSARDAILDANLVLTGGANHHLLWKAFAKRGLGVGARYHITHRRADFSVPSDTGPP